MAIQENDDPATDNKQGQSNNAAGGNQGSTFSGTTFSSAPSGNGSLLDLTRLINLDQADSTVEPYLQDVLKNLQTQFPNASYERLRRMNNSYAFMMDGPDGYKNFFCILFVSANESPTPKKIPASFRIQAMNDEIRERYSDQKIRITDARVIIVGYEPEMARSFEMAACITRSFGVTSIPEAKNATVDAMLGNEFSVNWNLTEARQLERSWSPHGVPPRMDIGMTLSAKIQNNFGGPLKEYEVDYQPIGVIGGYTEVRGQEVFEVNGQRKLLYRPIVNITVCNSRIPLEGVAAILLAAFGPAIYNSLWYTNQWSNLSAGEPQPGLLATDPETGRPYELKNREEVRAFVEEFFATPEISFQFQDGRDVIPNMYRLAATNAADKNHFGERLTNFFGVAREDLSNVTISQNYESRFEGVFGDPSGKLIDSREIDYLYLAAKNGVGSIDQRTKSIMMNGSENPLDRAVIVDEVSGGLKPLYLTTLTAINPTFIKAIVGWTQSCGLTLVDPNSQMEARPFGSFISGFGSPTGISSPVSSGFVRNGFGFSSVWNQ